jgi:hypothetical protein
MLLTQESRVGIVQSGAVGIATGYGWMAEGAEFKSLYGKDFSPLHVVKRPGHEADHSPPTRVEVKNTWTYTFTPPYVFME